MKVLNYPSNGNGNAESDLGRRIHRLIVLAKALANEVQTLQEEFSTNLIHSRDRRVNFDNDGIDFYKEVERYEIELIRIALDQCGGNQTRAARLLQMRSTTLNAKMKHYGLSSNRLTTTAR